MSKKDIMVFSDFFGSIKKSDFKKENFKDFFIDEEKSINIKESLDSEQESNDDEIDEEENEDTETSDLEEEIEKNNIVEKNNYYSIFRDKSENFSCDISVDGADINETSARLIIESSEWTIMFSGKIDKNGKCVIPIKKMNILNEGTIGKIRLEVIAEGCLLVPWETEFQVKVSKTVRVKVNENKYSGNTSTKKPGVKVNIRK